MLNTICKSGVRTVAQALSNAFVVLQYLQMLHAPLSSFAYTYVQNEPNGTEYVITIHFGKYI